MLSSGLFCLDPAEIVGFVPYRLNQERAEWTAEKKNKIKILIFFPYFFFKVKKKMHVTITTFVIEFYFDQ